MELIKFISVFFVVAMISCAPIKSDKFYYSPHHAHYFKYPDGDSIQQYLSVHGGEIYKDGEVDTVVFRYKWRAPLSRLKRLKAVETKLYYNDSTGKKVSVSYPVKGYLIYKDYPNTPYKIVRIPLVKNGDVCAMFNGLEDKFSNDQNLVFEFSNAYMFGFLPDGVEAEIKITWEDDAVQIFKTEVFKARNITDKVRSRPFG